ILIAKLLGKIVREEQESDCD
ncbi:hypothetical protein AALP_AAs63837U000100, partial [Arabis alpina]